MAAEPISPGILLINNTPTGYKVNGEDLNDIAEPYYIISGDSAYVNAISMPSKYKKCGAELNIGFGVEVTSVSISQGRFAKYTDYSNKLPVPYYSASEQIILCKKGCLPTTFSRFASITSTGTYDIIRGTDSSGDYLKIGSTYYRASSFRINYVPKRIGVIFCGGGGGAGGGGSEPDNKGWNVKCGGAGGGGAVVTAIIDFESYEYTYSIEIGAGGAGGTYPGGANSTGAYGTAGGTSVIRSYLFGDYVTSVSAGGGDRGEIGTPSGDANTQAAGGTVSWDLWDTDYQGIAGGAGGTHRINGGDMSLIESFKGKIELSINATGGSSKEDGTDSWRGSAAGGGASLGNGATNFSKTNGTVAVAGYGGGGAWGFTNSATYSNGGNGVAYFYY